MTDTANEDALIRDLLTHSKTIAVVGASPRPDRDSHGVMHFLMQRGYDVYPVNPSAGAEEILGRKVYAGLADVPVPIDIVDVFRRSEAAGEVCDEAIAAHAKAVWMQLGVINEEGAERARQAGLKVVMNRCPRIEMPRLGIAGPSQAPTPSHSD
jgi:predicted CoA-binding protein